MMTGGQALLLLVDIVIILVAAKVLGAVARRLGQPAVLGEFTVGLLFSPTLIGGWSHVLFRPPARSVLNELANIGVVLFVFGLGLELGNSNSPRPVGLRASFAIAAGAVVTPFTIGVLLAIGPFRPPEHSRGGSLAFALFMGIALAVTAVPVLARIILDEGLVHDPIGRLALSSAAICDVVAWSLLAVVAAMGGGRPPWLLICLPLLIAILFVMASTSARIYGWAGRRPRQRTLAFATTAICLLGAAEATNMIGLHLVFGAILFGVLLSRHAETPIREIHDFAHRVGRPLMPIFFAVAGLQVVIDVNASLLGLLAILILAASAGKMVGTYIPARICSLPHRSAVTLAVLMNTRGLTELVVLTTGLQLGVIDGRIYSLMVCMALITTIATGPLLRRAHPIPAPYSARGTDVARLSDAPIAEGSLETDR